MNFINQYIKKNTPRYIYSEQFRENGTVFIFAVGQYESRGLITKTDENGELLWERQYSIEKEELDLSIQKVVQVFDKKAGTSYVLYMSDLKGNRHFLFSINSREGTVNWINEFYPELEYGRFFLEASLTEPMFYLAVSGSENSQDYAPFVSKFDNSGTLQKFYRLRRKEEPFLLTAADSYEDGLLLGGNNLKSETALILDFDRDLNLQTSVMITDPACELHDIKFYSGKYLFIAKNHKTMLLFITLVELTGSSIRYNIPETEECTSSSLCLNSDGFYVTQFQNENGIVHQFDSNFNCNWSKEIVFSDNHQNGIHFITQLPDNFGQLTFTGYDEAGTAFLANATDALDTCKTSILNTISPFVDKSYDSIIQVDQEESNLTLKQTAVEIGALDSETKYICGDQPEQPEGTTIKTGKETSIQSPNFSLLAAGSTAADGSAKGIHLRWLFRGILGKKHLPKGDYAQTNYNFNKPDDYVRIYRAPYRKTVFTLSFQTAPTAVDDGNTLWIYNLNGRLFYIKFANITKYNSVRNSYDPFSTPWDFILAYGNERIEVESKKDLFFAARPEIANYTAASSIRTETLAVTENLLTAPKYTNSRKTYAGTSALSNVQLICENGRTVRYQTNSCSVSAIYFEFYSDFIELSNKESSWQILGKYALSLDENVVNKQLEPYGGLVDSHWPRYNDNAFVNTKNYMDKWNGPIAAASDRNIEMVVSKFIDLSNDPNNPSAIESIFLGSDGEQPETEDDMMDISLLDILTIGATDYHIARMLGLGTLDVTQEVTRGEFIYVSEYFTDGDLEDGLGKRTVQHLSVSLPTSIYDERLPLPVNITQILPGIVNEPDTDGPSNLTNPDGYTYDGRYRYVTLLADPDADDEVNQPFYATTEEFNRKDYSFPVYGGVEHRKNGETEWEKPELSNDPNYQNQVPAGQPMHNETIPLIVSEDTGVLYIHKQRDSGTHYYSSYGVNIFSRATASGLLSQIVTDLRPANLLKPPVKTNAQLVRSEQPLMLTSQQDQDRFALLSGAADKTLIRLTYDYHTFHELSTYKVEDLYDGFSDAQIVANNQPTQIYPDDREVYAEEVEIFFRNTVPQNVSGKAITITDDGSNPLISIITTGSYNLASMGQTLVPNLSAAVYQNYIGGMFIMGDQQFIIYDITPSATNPVIRVFKKEISDTLITAETPAPDADNLQSPVPTPDGLFMVVENMQNTAAWGSYNPHSLKVKVGTPGWTVNREIFYETNGDGITERFLEKSRGFWQNAFVEQQQEPIDEDGSGGLIYGFGGLYKITFTGFSLPQHAQYNANGVSVEWYNGIIRLKRQSATLTNGERSTFDAVRMENTVSGLTVYFQDPEFTATEPYDEVVTGSQLANYYPGYKIYLYADTSENLSEGSILPAQDEGVRYSIFGFRSHDQGYNYFSKICTPVLMFAQEIIEPKQPELPEGALYATRPDFFGKATYTFTTQFVQKPNSALFYRANDEAFLNALYEKSTIEAIRTALLPLGGNDEAYLTNRWENFLDFAQLAADNSYKLYPPADVSPDGFRLPVPDRVNLKDAINAFIDWHNDEYNENIAHLSSITSFNQVVIPIASAADTELTVLDFIEQAIYNSFVPLTELPIIYQHIKPNALHPQDYNPIPKKQNVKDRNGHILAPTDPEFDMAPMAKIAGTSPHKVLFTDFTLDGTSKNIYFYGVKEMTNQMKMGPFSPFLGPIKLVNTNPPEAPEIKRIMPVLGNEVLGTNPAIQFEINAYAKEQFIRKITIYRAFTMLDAQSIRTMTRVKEIDLEQEGILDNPVWMLTDEFADLNETPYGDSLFYRITVSRKVEYSEEGTGVIIEYAPSKPSKITATLIVESTNPVSPVLTYTSDPVNSQGELNNVVLHWNKTVYNGLYLAYKMNAQGNWTKFAEVVTNAPTISLALSTTDLGGTLDTINDEGNRIYHHFKVLAQNSVGMVSINENVLTI